MSNKKLTSFTRQHWEALSPKNRRLAVIGTVTGAMVLILYLFVTANPAKPDRGNPRDEVVKDILTDANTRELGIDGLNNRTRLLEKKITTLSSNISDLTKKLDDARKQASNSQKLADQLQALREELKKAKKSRGEAQLATPAPSNLDAYNSSTMPEPTSDIWEQPAQPAVMPATKEKNQKGGQEGSAPGSAGVIKIRTIGASTQAGGNEGSKTDESGTYLPAGSIVSGVLVTGMEAPTNNAARSEPFPALVRVKKDAILPNRYRFDVRECFIIASGYGSLSAERAYLRAEILSCVRNDGGVIEVPLKAYAVGEDGKVGLRGRVVSKQGQMLARSLAAGFFSGMSQVFGQAPIPTISTTSSGSVEYQNLLSTNSLTAGAVKGASSALDRLAKFYLGMAKDIFPVIEINANRRVEFVVTHGGELSPVSDIKNRNN